MLWTKTDKFEKSNFSKKKQENLEFFFIEPYILRYTLIVKINIYNILHPYLYSLKIYHFLKRKLHYLLRTIFPNFKNHVPILKLIEVYIDCSNKIIYNILHPFLYSLLNISLLLFKKTTLSIKKNFPNFENHPILKSLLHNACLHVVLRFLFLFATCKFSIRLTVKVYCNTQTCLMNGLVMEFNFLGKLNCKAFSWSNIYLGNLEGW